MRKLILVRHSQPTINHEISARHWRLSAEGRQRCTPLAQRLAAHQPAVVVTSIEPKASVTGQLIASALKIPCTTQSDLHEHDRSNVPFFYNKDKFDASVAAFFAEPDQLRFGLETANAACQRFSAAVDTVLERYPEGNVAIVSHGTVMTLLIAASNDIEPRTFWQKLELPSFVVLSLPDRRLIEVVPSVVGD